MNRQLVNLALELLQLKPTDQVLELFCGIGNFSLALAKHCQQVTAVEGSQEMVTRGYENASHNGINNVTFHQSNLATNNINEAWTIRHYDKILLDPPRTGALEIIQQLPRAKPQTIVYISCNPATLARDAGILVAQHGYRLAQVGVLDMFPHTTHIESIAVLVHA